MSVLVLHLTFHRCLNVVLYLHKEDYPEKPHLALCPNKQPSFEPFVRLDQTNNNNRTDKNDDKTTQKTNIPNKHNKSKEEEEKLKTERKCYSIQKMHARKALSFCNGMKAHK